MATEKIEITTDAGMAVKAMAPVIVSASRSTDLPAYYADWFMTRFQGGEGYVVWYNPFNRKPVYVSFKKTKVIVFWTKNANPLIKHLKTLDDAGIHYYFQFTINNYEPEQFEPNLPSLEKRIETFKALSDLIGPDRVIWRFDPIIFTSTLTPKEIATRIFRISQKLYKKTNKLVFSFIDVEEYRKVKNNLLKYSEALSQEFSKSTISQVSGNEELIDELCGYLQKMRQYWLEKGWDLELATCAEKVDLAKFGIQHNKCIDDALLLKCFGDDSELMEFLKPKVKCESLELFAPDETEKKIIPITSLKKDAGQRKECGCVESKDIGMYDTCVNGCIYCYANATREQAIKNLQRHRKNKFAESIWVPQEG